MSERGLKGGAVTQILKGRGQSQKGDLIMTLKRGYLLKKGGLSYEL